MIFFEFRVYSEKNYECGGSSTENEGERGEEEEKGGSEEMNSGCVGMVFGGGAPMPDTAVAKCIAREI